MSVEEFLKSVGAPKEAIKKCEEEAIDEIEQLLEMADELEELGVTRKGDQWRLKTEIEKLKKERELRAYY